MRKLPVFLASAASIGGAVSMALVAAAPRNAYTDAIFIIGLIITLGALSCAKRLARRL